MNLERNKPELLSEIPVKLVRLPDKADLKRKAEEVVYETDEVIVTKPKIDEPPVTPAEMLALRNIVPSLTGGIYIPHAMETYTVRDRETGLPNYEATYQSGNLVEAKIWKYSAISDIDTETPAPPIIGVKEHYYSLGFFGLKEKVTIGDLDHHPAFSDYKVRSTRNRKETQANLRAMVDQVTENLSRVPELSSLEKALLNKPKRRKGSK